MMSPFPIAAELLDAKVCARCGHPIWDRSEHASCAECSSLERAIPCSMFLLNEFAAADEVATSRQR